jgi:fibronectin-binding autotransporter adhesin
MKQKLYGSHFKCSIGLLAIALCLFAVSTSQAATYIWDPTGAGAGGGGAGTWDAATTSSWFDPSAGLPDILWPSGGDAEFDNTGGTVAVGAGGVTVGNMTFNGTSYKVSTTTANSITLTGKITVTGSSNTVNFGTSSTVPAIITGSAGLTKDGLGMLAFDSRGGGNTYTGSTTILAGTLSVNRESSLGATPTATDYNNIIMKEGTTFIYGLATSPNSFRGIRLDGTATFNQNVTGTLTWGGPITGSGGLNILETGSFRPGSNMLTYSGDTTLMSGSIAMGSDNPLPYAGNSNNGIAGTAGAGTGNVYLWSGTSIGMASYSLRINGLYDGTATGHGTGSISLSGSSSKTLTLGDNNANGSFSGAITGGKLTVYKMGNGTQILSSASNNFGSTTTNATSVSAGILNVNGSIGSLTASSGGTFSPIGSVLSSTALNVLGKLNFQAGSTDVFDFNSATAYDQINVSVGGVAGTVALGGTLQVNLGTFAPATTDKFWIIQNDLTDAVSGTFAGLAEGATAFTSGGTDWVIYYDADYATLNATPGSGNDVVLVAVPEPATLSMLFAALAAIGLTIVRKQRSK